MTPDTPPKRKGSPGRRRDSTIDDAVLAATRALLVDLGYARLTVAAVAGRAGTTKTAIYRRWSGKPELVHDAALGDLSTVSPRSADLVADVRAMIDHVRAVLGSPVARAALPGLIADMAADPDLHRRVLAGFADAFGGIRTQLIEAVADGRVRADVDPRLLVEVLGGAAILRVLIDPAAPLDDEWADHLLALVLPGLRG
ncbi:MAG: TetR/AcrR family transcriptional regulator [Gordonia sp. (in: high G+C Gram-positive bacteria)]